MLRLFRRAETNGPNPRDSLEVTHEGVSFRIALKRVAGARRFTLRVRTAHRDVVITMPRHGSRASALDFAQRHAAWIAARVHRLPEAIPFRNGATFPLRGKNVEIVHQPLLRGGLRLERSASGSSDRLIVACDERHVSRRIHDYLRREAKRDLTEAVRRHAGSLGHVTPQVTVRDTTSRWGSCSASGSLNFSWRLIMAPSDILDYLAAHEVAHLVHMNHSDEFWAVAKRLAPHTDRAEAWLRAHGSRLYCYGIETDQEG